MSEQDHAPQTKNKKKKNKNKNKNANNNTASTGAGPTLGDDGSGLAGALSNLANLGGGDILSKFTSMMAP